MTITLYGIPNCDTVKKARTWLADHGIEYVFHDFKKQGVPRERLDRWIEELGWQKLVNRQGTTWRKLDPAVQEAVKDAAAARQLMLDNASVIKRPVVEWGESATVGFDANEWNSRARVA
ncbi:MAG TPA: ArsC family reductase [Ramlibacter sp.]|nr:ArsC family reductase [Ramlibacter sp.]